MNSTLVLPAYEKEEEEKEKGDMDKCLAKTKRGKGSIQQQNLIGIYSIFW